MTSIEIRRTRPEDAEHIVRYLCDEAVFSQLLQLPFPDVNVWRKKLEVPLTPGSADMRLSAVRNEEVIGCADLHGNATALRRRHSAALGITVAREAQGTGVGHALMHALTDYADRWTDLLRLELTVYTDNVRAIRLYKKFGFESEGRLRGYAYRDGQLVDVYSMARLRKQRPWVTDQETDSAGKAPGLTPRDQARLDSLDH